MKNLLILLAHLLTTLAKLLRPGGARAIVAVSLFVKQQLLIINRSRKRAPNLTPMDRTLLGFRSLFLKSHHIQRAAVILRPSTLLRFHNILKKRKYRLLDTARKTGKAGPKGPSQELIDAIVELKRRNTWFGCPRIAQEIKTVPYTPTSHPFIERLIGTIRREFLDHTRFWNAADLERKLADFQASQPTSHP